VLALAAALALMVPSTASAFNPATQSHLGACAVSTDNIPLAVSNLQANDVLAPVAAALGLAPTVNDLKKWLVIGVVKHLTVTDNHGCDGFGGFFGVGGRTLFGGEHVGVRVPANLRKRACIHPGGNCVPITIVASVVLPTNCWNINTGPVVVTIYVHPKPKPKVAKPSATASFSCSAGGVIVVRLSNARNATASASFTINGIHYGALKPGHSETLTFYGGGNGASTTVTVRSGKRVLIDRKRFTNSCVGPPVPKPTAQAALDCSVANGQIVVTLTNATTATGPATFNVNGVNYGPVAPGKSLQVPISVSRGSSATITVTSGGKTLVSQSITNDCTVPSATAELACDLENPGGTITVTFANGASAKGPATFVVTATGANTQTFNGTYGPVSPGGTLQLPITFQNPFPGQDIHVVVTSGGNPVPLLDHTYHVPCVPL
jgi:hypothetical protein